MTDMNTDINPGVRGQTRATWRDVTHLRGLLLRLVQENPDADREDVEALFVAKVEMSAALIEEAARYAFDNNWDAITKPKSKPRTKISAAAVAAVAKQVKSIVLLDLVLPGGKALRDATGAECEQAGGWYIKVGKRVGKQGIVGATLSEAQVAEIFTTSVK